MFSPRLKSLLNHSHKRRLFSYDFKQTDKKWQAYWQSQPKKEN